MKALWRKLRFAVGTALEVAVGVLFLSSLGQFVWARSQRLFSDNLTIEKPGNLGMVAHVYYPHMLPEILEVWARFPAGSKLFITTTADKLEAIGVQLGSIDATIRVFDNRGRDIAPFLHLLAEGTFDGLGAVLKLHTKRSPHLLNGGIRRRMLLAVLGGTLIQISKAAARFQSPKVGIMGWAACFRTKSAYWMANRERVGQVMEAIGSHSQPTVAFFEGAMFWFKPEAIKFLAISFGDHMSYEQEAGQLDGALHHAIERSFVLAAAHSGHETLSMNGRRLMPAEEATDTAGLSGL